MDNVNPNQLHGEKIELNSQKHNVLGKHNTNKKIVYHGQIKRKRNFKNNQEIIPPLKQEEINNSNILNKSNYNSNMVVKSRRIIILIILIIGIMIQLDQGKKIPNQILKFKKLNSFIKVKIIN